MRLQAESELTGADWQLIHAYRNNRALQRRKQIHPKLRDRLELLVPELERQAFDRGLAMYLGQWRAYPETLTFGSRVGASGVEHLAPPTVKRRRRADPPTATLDGCQLLELLERSLAERVAASSIAS